MGWLSKTFKKVKKTVKKAWDEVDDYAVPILAGAGIGALVGGGTGAAMGALGGLQIGQSERAMEKQEMAAKEAEKEAYRQQVAINSAATGSAEPVATTTTADTGLANWASAKRRRYSTGKTTRASSGLGLARYATSTTSRSTLG